MLFWVQKRALADITRHLFWLKLLQSASHAHALCSPVQMNYWLDSVATLRINYQVLSLVSAQQIEPGLLSSQSINNLPFKPALSMKSASVVLHLHVQDVATELRRYTIA